MKSFKVVVLIVVGGGILASGVVGLGANSRTRQLPPQPEASTGRTVLRMDPASDSELLLAEFEQDSSGSRTLRMKGPLTTDKLTQTVVTVDMKTGTYRTFDLANPEQDAKRIRSHFLEKGKPVAEEAILRERLRQDRAREMKDHTVRRGRAQERGRARGRSGVEEEPSLLEALESFQQPDGAEAMEVGALPCAADIDDGFCQGQGYARIETWEPARYVYNVDVLTRTSREAVWERDQVSGGVNAISTAPGSCWSNPDTFVHTYWYTLDCFTTFSPGGGFTTWFDSTMTGEYFNFNFFLDSAAAVVVDTAAVQYVNGSPNWGTSHNEENLGLFNFYEDLFLSFQVVGEAFEYGCNVNCSPTEAQIHDCETGEDFATWDWDQCVCSPGASPIILDLDGDGLALTGFVDGVNFDLMAEGVGRRVGWTAAGARDPFLVLDRNGNGLIDDGRELFGNVTEQPTPEGRVNKNGFLALAEFDTLALGGNDDGRISATDLAFSSLQLWFDLNHDGVSQLEELFGLAEVGVAEISLKYQKGKRVDEFGNIYGYTGKVKVTPTAANSIGPRRNAPRRAYDIYFAYQK